MMPGCRRGLRAAGGGLTARVPFGWTRHAGPYRFQVPHRPQVRVGANEQVPCAGGQQLRCEVPDSSGYPHGAFHSCELLLPTTPRLSRRAPPAVVDPDPPLCRA
jgi:hypothetical protein